MKIAVIILSILALASVVWAITVHYRSAKTMKSLQQMVNNAIDGTFEETVFDESQYSALEARMAQYLQSSQLSQRNLSKERDKIKTLISDISHQTKTPITNILLYAQILAEKETMPPEDRDIVRQIADQSERLQFLISALINLSRLEADIISVKPVSSHVKELLDTVAAQGESAAEQKNITLEVQCDPEITATMDENGPQKHYGIWWTMPSIYASRRNVSLSAEAHEMFCTIKVRDNGMGIDDQEQSRIFSRFYRSPRVRKEPGVGIGLYLSRQIISAQDGFIKVYSKLGKGTVFSVSLPIRATEKVYDF